MTLLFDKVFVDQGIDGLDADIGRDIAGLQVADQGVDQHAVTYFDGDLGQVLVGAVHGVAQLQSGNVGPTAFVEHGAGLGRGQVDTRDTLSGYSPSDRTLTGPAMLNSF